MINFCSNCGTQVTGGNKFCTNCGAPLEAVAAAQPEAPPQSSQPTYFQQPASPPADLPVAPQAAQPTAPSAAPPAAQPVYTQTQNIPAPKKRKSKKGCLIALGCVIGFIIVAVIAANIILGNTANKDYYNLGSDKIPSIKLVVEKRALSKTETVITGGVTTMQLVYKKIENPSDDIAKYLFYLQDNEGFGFTKDFDSRVIPGSTQMAKESADKGYVIILDAEYYDAGYTLVFTKGEGTYTPNVTKNELKDNKENNEGANDNTTTNTQTPTQPTVNEKPVVSATVEKPQAFPEDPTLFDFSVFPEADFPRGAWTVKQLIGKYGTADQVFSYYLSDYGIAFANALFTDYQINFFPVSAESFSFYHEGLDDDSYPFAKNDLDIELEILSLRITDTNLLFPYQIKIGQSTKAQILDIYTIEPAFVWNNEETGNEMISYWYAFRDDEGNLPEDGYYGSVDYIFDENEVLEEVIISWHYFDL